MSLRLENITKIKFNKNSFLLGFFYLTAIFPLLDYGISAIILGAFLVLNLVVNGLKISPIWFFSLFFIYILLISFYYSGIEDSMKRLSKSMLLLVTPIVLSSFKMNIKILKNFTKVYIWSILLKSLLCLFLLVRDKSFIDGRDIPILSIEFHATYFSYEVMIAILLIYFFIENRKKILLLIFLSITVIVFQKKIALIVLLLFWIYHIKKSKQYFTLLLIPICAFVFYIKSDFFTKIKILTEAALKGNLMGEDRVRLRLMEAAWHNFNEAPYFGKGAVEHTLYFFEYNLKHLGIWAQDYNTHNYFLFVLCSGGILGLLLFIFPFLYSLIKYSKASQVYAIFLVTTMFYNFTESHLDRYNGVLPFVIFNFVFFSYYDIININQKQVNLKA
jgi:hypothetical protein